MVVPIVIARSFWMRDNQPYVVISRTSIYSPTVVQGESFGGFALRSNVTFMRICGAEITSTPRETLYKDGSKPTKLKALLCFEILCTTLL